MAQTILISLMLVTGFALVILAKSFPMVLDVTPPHSEIISQMISRDLVDGQDTLTRLVKSLKGKKFLVLQADNRARFLFKHEASSHHQPPPSMHDFVSEHEMEDSLDNLTTPKTEKPTDPTLKYGGRSFASSQFGPSLLSTYLWAKQKGYGYLLYSTPQESRDPFNRFSFSPRAGWAKVPAMVIGHRIAKMAGIKGIIYVDSDASPMMRFRVANDTTRMDPESPGEYCDHRVVDGSLKQVNDLDSFILQKEMQYKTSFSDPEAKPHYFLYPAHAQATTWVYRKMRFGKDSMPVINSGTFMLKVSNFMEKELNRWWLEMTQMYSPFEISTAYGKFQLETVGSSTGWSKSSEDVTREYHREERHGVQQIMNRFKDDYEDLRNASMCTPKISKLETRLFMFQCRGHSVQMLNSYWKSICEDSAKLFGLKHNQNVRCLSPPNLPNQQKKQLAKWPGGRLLMDGGFEY